MKTSREIGSPGRSILALLLSLGVVVTIAGMSGCSSSNSEGSSEGTGATGGGGGAGGGGGGGPSGPSAYELFLKIEPDLVANCNICHKKGGSAPAPFLAGMTPEERYQTITFWPGIVVKAPEQSILLTHPESANHGGGEAPRIPEGVKPGVLEWLTAEAAGLPEGNGDIGPSVRPFRPLPGGALNTVYLDALGEEFQYMSIAFFAEALGGTSDEPTMLRLTNITVHPVVDKPLHIMHPVFTVYVPGQPGDPDPVDSFSNLDQTFTLGGDNTLGTGEVVLTNWQKGAYLGIAFELIEVYGGNAGPGTGCANLTLFQQEVVPVMQTCMMKCHGGANPQAKGTMDLSELNAMMPTAACQEVRARIKPGDPATSQILQVTDPVQPIVHMYKFDGDLNAYNAFKTKVEPWIMAEQQ
ncbi:cytochrome c [Polyangium sp. y55x31]|uniref:c-type cytochrome n=1 Tax=Polyangium sp. y55x31 TaxID=3042688 RepID=UPI00248320FC|nr:cytochrome c [Polyangium sp. y55x31]MDI1475589.1 cytochrome c [Polyangium sp. y55x31]